MIPRILALLALAATLAAPVTRAQERPDGWSEPVLLSENTDYPSSWFASLALTPNDGVAVVWYSATRYGTEWADLLMYREKRDGRWSPENEIIITGVGGWTVRNSMVFGRDGRLHVLLRSKTNVQYTSADYRQSWSAHAWIAPQTIGNSAYYNALAISSQGNLHALWSQTIVDPASETASDCANCADIMYRRSEDGGRSWSALVNLSKTTDGENRPQIVIDDQDHIHVAWDQGADWYAGDGEPKYGIYRRSEDGGKTWTDPIQFGLPDDTIQQTTLAVTPDGNPFIVYRSVAGGQIYFQQSRDVDNQFVQPEVIPSVRARNIGDNNLDRYSMAVDGDGNIHLLMVGFITGDVNEPTNPSLLHLTWDGDNWSQPEPIRIDEYYPEWPQIAVADGNHLHAVWFTRNASDLYGSDKGARYKIWYSTRVVDARDILPLPLFTPVPSTPSAARPSPTVAPSPTALATTAAHAPLVAGPPRWEQPGVITVGLAVSPIAALIAGLGVVHAMRRRR